MKSSVLVISGDPDASEVIADALSRADFEVTTTTAQDRALALAKTTCFELAIVVNGPQLSEFRGIGLVRQFRLLYPDTEIILSSKHPTMAGALKGVQESAYDYIGLPEDLDRLPLAAREAVASRRQRLGRAFPSRESLAESAIDPEALCASMLIGRSPGMAEVRRQVVDAASSNRPVLIIGGRGSGKDLVAQSLHKLSHRSRIGTFIKVNCPSIDGERLAAEFFGYARGAFPSLVPQKPGWLELAHNGTLYLDEIGSVSPAVQEQIERILATPAFTRVGGQALFTPNVRVVASASEPLEPEVETREFRADLYQRLSHAVITLPPLHERPEDIMVLCEHFVHVYGGKYGVNDGHMPTETLSKLLTYEWPGNVRELESTVARFVLCGIERRPARAC